MGKAHRDKPKHLVIPDVQAKDGVSLEHLDWCGKYILRKRPDVVICIGDFADMPSLSSYDAKGSKSYESKRYWTDIEVTKKAMKTLLTPLHEHNAEMQRQKKQQYHPRLVMTLGNHEDRITRAIEADPQHLEGVISLEDLGYKEAGWEVYPFLQPVVIDGIAYCHYFPTGKLGKPAGSARQIISQHHMSAFAGHAQGRDIAYAKRIDGKKMTAIICGSFYQHDETYMPIPSNQHWRGIYVLHEVDDGQFDEMPVSLGFLEAEYGEGREA